MNQPNANGCERPYNNSRRAEQAQENRSRIIGATLRLMVREDELTIPRIAEEAGLSVPTVYRNFATREDLLAAADEAFTASLGAPPRAESIENLPALLPSLHAYFGANADGMRLLSRRPSLRDIVDAGRRTRDRHFLEMVQAATPNLAEEDSRALAGVLRVLTGSEAYLTLHDRFNLSEETSGRVVGWIVWRLLEDAVRHRGSFVVPVTEQSPG